jgi:hypothetical protein
MYPALTQARFVATLREPADEAAEALEQSHGNAAEHDRPVRLYLGDELDARHGRIVPLEPQGELTIRTCGLLRGPEPELRPSRLEGR